MRKEQFHELLMRHAISPREMAIEMGQKRANIMSWLQKDVPERHDHAVLSAVKKIEAKSGVQLDLPNT